MLLAGLVKSKVMLCRLIFKAITGFFTLLSPCIFNNLLSNDLSPPYPPLPTPPIASPPHSSSSSPTLPLPLSFRHQRPNAPLPASASNPLSAHISPSLSSSPTSVWGCAQQKKTPAHTHAPRCSLPPELTVLTHVCVRWRLCLPSSLRHFPTRPFIFDGKRSAPARGDSAGGTPR